MDSEPDGNRSDRQASRTDDHPPAAGRPGVLTERELVVQPSRVESAGRRGSRAGVIGIVGAAAIIIGVGLFGGSLGRLIPSPTDRASFAAASPDTSAAAASPTRPRSTPFGVGAGIVPGAWRAISEGPLAARTGQTAVWTGREMIIWGGDSGRDDLGAAYDPATDSWRLIRPAPIQARIGHLAVWTGHEMLIWGGMLTDAANPEQTLRATDGAAYDPETDTWQLLATHEVGPDEAEAITSAAAWTGIEWIVVDGFPAGSSTVRLAVAAYDPAADRWRDLPGVAVPGDSSMAVTWIGDALVLVASRYDLPADVLRWSPDHGWESVSEPPIIGGDISSTILFTGTEVIVRGSVPFDEGGLSMLDVGSWTWRQIRGMARLALEVQPVWTGVHAVYGDRAYDPMLDRWRTMYPLIADLRDGASAIWTGDRLVEWGGEARSPGPTGVAFVPDVIRVEAASALPFVGSVDVEIEDRWGHLVSARSASAEEVRSTPRSAAASAGLEISQVPGDDHSILARFGADPAMVSARIEIAPDGHGVALERVPIYGDGPLAIRGFVLAFDEAVDPFRLIGG